ncbi:MAG TPA: hypothetical protein PKH02_01345 [Bacteroidales bacterium]|nr:hypothetical protein [Bacteroidales bacterium]HPT11205.1 hypothetical protein [Bacteroidales bacterium]
MINSRLPVFTTENEELTHRLEQLNLEFLNLYTCHKDMVENESPVLTSLYIEKLGRTQLELLEKQTEASRLRMKMNMIQAAINRDEKPDLKKIDFEINNLLQDYYTRIKQQSAALDTAEKVLSNMLTEEETKKLKEAFRVLCKRLHPDINPNQSEEEKDLFIKATAAYDLQDIYELQKIILYLDESHREKLELVTGNEKKERIKHLEKNIAKLEEAITLLKASFPFNIQDLIYDDEQVKRKQEEIREKINEAEKDIGKYSEIINIMCDE